MDSFFLKKITLLGKIEEMRKSKTLFAFVNSFLWIASTEHTSMKIWKSSISLWTKQARDIYQGSDNQHRHAILLPNMPKMHLVESLLIGIYLEVIEIYRYKRKFNQRGTNKHEIYLRVQITYISTPSWLKIGLTCIF